MPTELVLRRGGPEPGGPAIKARVPGPGPGLGPGAGAWEILGARPGFSSKARGPGPGGERKPPPPQGLGLGPAGGGRRRRSVNLPSPRPGARGPGRGADVTAANLPLPKARGPGLGGLFTWWPLLSLSVATAEMGANGGGNGRQWRRKWAPMAAEMGASGDGNGRQRLHKLTSGGCSDRLSERRQPQQNCFSGSQPGARAHPSERVSNQRKPQTASARITRQRLRRSRASGSVHGLSASLDSGSSLSSSAGGPESEPR